MIEYPEHEKLEAVEEQSQACGEFLEWLLSVKGYQVCEHVEGHSNGEPRYLTFGETEDGRPIYEDNTDTREPKRRSPDVDAWRRAENPAYFYTPTGFYPVRQSIEALLAEHFGIDRKKLEAEKRAMLAKMRAA